MSLIRFFPAGDVDIQTVPDPVEVSLCEQLFHGLSEQIASDKLTLPRAPEVALEALRVSCLPTSSVSQLSRPLKRDPFLAGRLLQLANSASYAPRARQIVSLQEAAVRVGMRGVRDLLLASVIKQNIFRGPRQGLLRQMWLYSISRAVAADRIAQQLRRWDDSAFTLGLMVDVGRPILVSFLDEMSSQPDSLFTFEQAWSAVDVRCTTVAAEALFDAWALPAVLREALHTRSPDLEVLLWLAGWLASAEDPEPATMAHLGSALGLRESAAAKIIDGFPDAVQQVS